MCKRRIKRLQDVIIEGSESRLVLMLLISLSILASPKPVRSQTQTSNLPGPAIREGNRSMDDYDRALSRMKNDAKAANERRRNLFPQINEDFQRIQVIHNEIVRMIQPGKSFNYDRLAELSDDMKKRSSRLRENLALPEPEKTDVRPNHSEPINTNNLKNTIGDLHELVVSFVANPIFKNLGVVDAKQIDSARESLEGIVAVSDEIKRDAKILSKTEHN